MLEPTVGQLAGEMRGDQWLLSTWTFDTVSHHIHIGKRRCVNWTSESGGGLRISWMANPRGSLSLAQGLVEGLSLMVSPKVQYRAQPCLTSMTWMEGQMPPHQIHRWQKAGKRDRYPRGLCSQSERPEQVGEMGRGEFQCEIQQRHVQSWTWGGTIPCTGTGLDQSTGLIHEPAVCLSG